MKTNELLKEIRTKTSVKKESKKHFNFSMSKNSRKIIRYSLNAIVSFIILLVTLFLIGIYSLKNVVNPKFGETLKEIKEISPEIDSQIGFFNGFVFFLNENRSLLLIFGLSFIFILASITYVLNKKVKGKNQ